MQFVAERRIENGLQIVTPFFLNSPNCLYIKKSCNLLQSYAKSRAKQKKHFFFLPRRSKFAYFIGKVTKKYPYFQMFSMVFLTFSCSFSHYLYNLSKVFFYFFYLHYLYKPLFMSKIIKS